LRLAYTNYLRKGVCSTLAKAVERLFRKDEVLHWVKQFGISQEWREALLNIPLDMTISRRGY